jgi:ABC-type multidrug transport system ATPase subunit
MAPQIETESLSKSFGRYKVIDQLSLKINAGTVYGLVGLNGAGKTTLLRLLLGILEPDEGTLRVLGHTPWKHECALYRQCGVVLENDGFWGNLTPYENCSIYASAKGIPRDRLNSYLERFWKGNELFPSTKKVKTLSRGQRMQCALCRAFMGEPSVCFLDEPAVALDINAYEHFTMLVNTSRERGAAIIISSHQLDTIDQLCNRVGILREGSITEISRHGENGSTIWYIADDDAPYVRDILLKAGGTDITFNDGWYFSLADAQKKIPEIIRSLVAAGSDIREVRQESRRFGEAIRMLYAGNKPGVPS